MPSASSPPDSSSDDDEEESLEDDEEEYQETLKGLTGIRTVPQVFVFGEFVGGSDDTMVAYESGKLERMLAGG